MSERGEEAVQRPLPRRILALVLAATVALTALTACLAVSERAHHDCTGDDCPACQLLAASSHALTFSAATPGKTAAPASAGPALAATFTLAAVALSCRSLVALKTRFDI